MSLSYCSSTNAKERKLKYHQRKLEMLLFFRDNLEQKLSSLNASINTLESQIERDREVTE